jgi:hypothetical protein
MMQESQLEEAGVPSMASVCENTPSSNYARMEVRQKEWIGGNAGPIWPPDQKFFAAMTAIGLVYTARGFILAADGRSRFADDSMGYESDQEQKVFSGEFGTLEIAWAVAGNIFNRDRSFSLIDHAKRSFDVANAAFNQGFGQWFSRFAFCLRKAISDARETGLLGPFPENQSVPSDSQERFTFARVFTAGYPEGGKPSIAIARLHHSDGVLGDPQLTIYTPPQNDLFSGSDEISKRYFREHQDGRFKRYFHPPGTTLADGLAHAKGYIEACSDPLAQEIDPLCKGIGGHIHAAAVTPSGFEWLIPPRGGSGIE